MITCFGPLGSKLTPGTLNKVNLLLDFACAEKHLKHKYYDIMKLSIVFVGIYIGWRCPEFKHDCQRVGSASKCFCGHLLGEHGNYNGKKLFTLAVF